MDRQLAWRFGVALAAFDEIELCRFDQFAGGGQAAEEFAGMIRQARDFVGALAVALTLVWSSSLQSNHLSKKEVSTGKRRFARTMNLTRADRQKKITARKKS